MSIPIPRSTGPAIRSTTEGGGGGGRRNSQRKIVLSEWEEKTRRRPRNVEFGKVTEYEKYVNHEASFRLENHCSSL